MMSVVYFITEHNMINLKSRGPGAAAAAAAAADGCGDVDNDDAAEHQV